MLTTHLWTIFKGDGAPKDVHPSRLKKSGSISVNFNQRIPRESVDIIQSTVEFGLVKEAFADYFEFIHDLVSYLHLHLRFV